MTNVPQTLTTPVRRLTCCCCGSSAGKWQQHWNRDRGYGICRPCFESLRASGKTDEDELRDCYGTEGINYAPAAGATTCAHCGGKMVMAGPREWCSSCKISRVKPPRL